MSTTATLIGYVASGLVLTTFAMTDLRRLRMIAVLSNIAFIAYGALAWLPPVLGLHLLLLPLNLLRLMEMRKPPSGSINLGPGRTKSAALSRRARRRHVQRAPRLAVRRGGALFAGALGARLGSQSGGASLIPAGGVVSNKSGDICGSTHAT